MKHRASITISPVNFSRGYSKGFRNIWFVRETMIRSCEVRSIATHHVLDNDDITEYWACVRNARVQKCGTRTCRASPAERVEASLICNASSTKTKLGMGDSPWQTL